MFDLLLLIFLIIFVVPIILAWFEGKVRDWYRKPISCGSAHAIVSEQQPVKKKLTKPTQVYTAEQKKEFYDRYGVYPENFYDKYGFNPEDMGDN